MINSNIHLFQAYLEQKGYQCSLCCQNFGTSGNTIPFLLSCHVHNICRECFKNMQRTLENCPQCNVPLAFKATAIPNVKIIRDIRELQIKLGARQERDDLNETSLDD